MFDCWFGLLIFVGEKLACLGHSRLDRSIEQASRVAKEAPWGAVSVAFFSIFLFSKHKTTSRHTFVGWPGLGSGPPWPRGEVEGPKKGRGSVRGGHLGGLQWEVGEVYVTVIAQCTSNTSAMVPVRK